MDPDAILQELREMYNEYQDGEASVELAEEYAELFDDLDNHITRGGALPAAWRR